MGRVARHEQHGQRLVLALVVVLVVAGAALAAVLLGRGDGEVAVVVDQDPSTAPTEAAEADAPATTSEAAAPCPPAEQVPEPTATAYEQQPTTELAGAETVRATLRTTCGDIVVALDADGAPATVANFVALAEDGYYAGVGFHRVIDDFMIQGGDPTGTGSGCVDEACTVQLPGYTFADELGPARQVVEATGGYPRGVLAMANRGPDTNGSQFFIVQAPTGYPLPPEYAVFGTVESGMDVVDRIALGPVDGQLAVDPVVILGVDVQR